MAVISKRGIFHYHFQCENGTLTEEICENGLAYDGHGNVYNHCNYNWAVDCGDPKSKSSRTYDDTPTSASLRKPRRQD